MKTVNVKSVIRKSLSLLCAFGLGAVLFTACTPDDEPKGEPYFTITDADGNEQTGYTSAAAGNIISDKDLGEKYYIRSNRSWKLVASEDNVDWVRFFPDEGDCDGLIRLRVDENNTFTERQVGFRILVDGKEQPVMFLVQQERSIPYITLSVDKDIEIEKMAQNISFSIKANVDYTYAITAGSDWFTLVSDEGTTASRKFVFNATDNESSGSRVATVAFTSTASPDANVTLTVTQGFYMPSSGDVLYYESIGMPSATTKIPAWNAAAGWVTTGYGSGSVVYSSSGDASTYVDVRNTVAQGTTTASSPADGYGTYEGATPGGNLYFGNDSSADLANSWFYINNISLLGVKSVAWSMGMLRTVDNADARLTISYKFDNQADWTVWQVEPGPTRYNRWELVSYPAIAVPAGAKQINFSIHPNVKQSYRIDDFKLEVGSETFTEPMKGLDVPAEWAFSAELMSAYTDQFVTNNAFKSNISGNGTIGFVFQDGVADPDAKRVKVIGGTGHPYVTGVWPGDYWLFSVPVTNFRAGTKVNITFITRPSGTGHRFWTLEYLDGSEWKPAGELKTLAVEGVGEVKYTHDMNDLNNGDSNHKVDVTVTFAKSIADGKVQFRFVCAANWQNNNSGALEKPNGGTHRIAGAPADAAAGTANTSPKIMVVE